MKIHNLLSFVLVLYVTTIYAGYFSNSNDTRTDQQVALYQEMPTRFSSSYASLSRVPHLNYNARSSTSDLIAIDESQNLVVNHAPQFLIESNGQERAASALMQPFRNQATTNTTLIPSDARIVEVPVPVVLEDYRTSRGQMLSLKTRVAFAFVLTFSMIEFGFNVIDVVDYYVLPQPSNARPTLPIAKLANSTIRNVLLYALYKFNADALG